MRGFSEETTPHYIAFESYGVPIEVRASEEEVLARLGPVLPPISRRLERAPENKQFGIVSEGGGKYTVWSPRTMVCTHIGLELALVTVEGQIRSWVAVLAPEVIFVHAGAVGHDGGAIVIPGESFAGKTTLVAELVRRGATYFSDEFAVVDRDGLVHPFPKRLSVRVPDSGPVLTTPESIGGEVADEALPMTLACVTHYVPGAEWRPRRLSAGEAAIALLSRTVPARIRPQECMEFLARAVKDAVVLEGERGEAEDFATMLFDDALV
jgi:hypothetical protein